MDFGPICRRAKRRWVRRPQRGAGSEGTLKDAFVTRCRADRAAIRRPTPGLLNGVAVILLVFVSASCATAVRTSRPIVTAAGVRFTLVDPAARSVAVAGSFNHWSRSSHLLVRETSGAWTLVVALPPGDYLFMYVVNGSDWITPPLAEDYVDDGF